MFCSIYRSKRIKLSSGWRMCDPSLCKWNFSHEHCSGSPVKTSTVNLITHNSAITSTIQAEKRSSAWISRGGYCDTKTFRRAEVPPLEGRQWALQEQILPVNPQSPMICCHSSPTLSRTPIRGFVFWIIHLRHPDFIHLYYLYFTFMYVIQWNNLKAF